MSHAVAPVAEERRAGRRPSTSRDEIAQVAFRLFVDRGFDATTVDDIAEAVGIGRRTLFRYFPSKNEIVWGDWEGELDRLRTNLAAVSHVTPLMRAIREAVLATNDFGAEDLPELRVRMQLLVTVPTLQAYSTLRYMEWRDVIARFAAARVGQDVEDVYPQSLAHATLGVTLAAFLRWVRLGGTPLRPLLERALRHLETGFTEPTRDDVTTPS